MRGGGVFFLTPLFLQTELTKNDATRKRMTNDVTQKFPK